MALDLAVRTERHLPLTASSLELLDARPDPAESRL